MSLDFGVAGGGVFEAAERMNRVSFHWERYDITALAREGLAGPVEDERRQAPASSAAEIGATDATARRGADAARDLAGDTAAAGREIAHPRAATHGGTAGQIVARLQANVLSLQYLSAGVISSAGGFALGALVDVVASGARQEREIAWPGHEGYMLIRCIAQPRAQAGGRFARAPSVATKIVELQTPARLARGSLNLPDAVVAERRVALELERKRHPPDPDRIRRLETELGDAQASASGSVRDAIDVAIRELTAERNAATGAAREPLQARLDALNEQRRRAETSAGRVTGRVFRPRATFVSRVTGETYPLLLQLGELTQQGSTHVFQLSDETTRDGRRYQGRGSTPSEAAWNAFVALAERSEYGRGEIAVRMPEDAPFQPGERSFTSAPRGEALARQRIDEMVSILVTLGLFVPAVGEAAAVIGAGLAVSNMIDRWRQNSLRFDTATINDLFAVLGAIGQHAAMIGRARVLRESGRFLLLAEGTSAAEVQQALTALRGVRRTARGLEIANDVANWGGFLFGVEESAQAIARINEREMRGELSHADARRDRADYLAGLIRDSVIQVVDPPRRARAEPVHGATDPSHGATEPAHGATEPAHGATEPAHDAGEHDADGAHPADERGPHEPHAPAAAEHATRAAENQPVDAPDTIVAEASLVNAHAEPHEVHRTRDGTIYRCSWHCQPIVDVVRERVAAIEAAFPTSHPVAADARLQHARADALQAASAHAAAEQTTREAKINALPPGSARRVKAQKELTTFLARRNAVFTRTATQIEQALSRAEARGRVAPHATHTPAPTAPATTTAHLAERFADIIAGALPPPTAPAPGPPPALPTARFPTLRAEFAALQAIEADPSRRVEFQTRLAQLQQQMQAAVTSDLPAQVAAARGAQLVVGSGPTGPRGGCQARAESGAQTESGWSSSNHPTIHGQTTPQVVAIGASIGHTFAPDTFRDNGVPGRYHASHAEKQLNALRPGEPIGVSIRMCADCYNYFRLRARSMQRTLVVADPEVTRIFHPDGRVEVPALAGPAPAATGPTAHHAGPPSTTP